MSPESQKERIRQAVMRSVQARDLYTEQQVKKMLSALKQAENGVKAELLRIKEKSIISKGLEVRRSQLTGIQNEIDAITRDLKKEMSLISKRSLTGAYRKSFKDVVNEWAEMGVPSYSNVLSETYNRISATSSGSSAANRISNSNLSDAKFNPGPGDKNVIDGGAFRLRTMISSVVIEFLLTLVNASRP